jgi:hypothetical protein
MKCRMNPQVLTVYLAAEKSRKVPTSEREGKLSNPRALRARDAWRKFTEIYGNPRACAARAACVDFAATKYTVSTRYSSTKY